MALTGRERLLRVFAGQPVDRVPVSPFVHVNFVREFYSDHDADGPTLTPEVYRHFGFDLIHRNCTPAYDPVGSDQPQWRVEKHTEKQGRDETTTTVIHTPGGDLREVHRICWTSEYDAESTPVEYLIKSEEDLDLVMRYQPPAEEFDTSPIARAKDATGDEGLVAPWYPGAFAYVALFFRSLDELILDAMLRPEMYHRMMRHFLERSKQLVSQCISAGVDIVSYPGNVAGGKLGEAFFREHVLDYENELIDFIQSRGPAVLYHNCGYAKSLFSAYTGMRMRAYESLTPPPYGDTVLAEALEAFRPDVALIGNLDQIEFLRRATPAEVQTQVKQVLEPAKRRGNFILGTTDYFTEGTPYENLFAVAEAARKFGCY